MNMISKVVADGEAKRLRLKLAQRPLWQRSAIVGTPLVALAAAVTLWSSDPSPAAAPAARRDSSPFPACPFLPSCSCWFPALPPR